MKNVITAASFNRYYTEGKIDVVWLDTNNNVILEPNIPVLTKKDGETTYGLTAVEYDSTQTDYWKEADTSKEWYKYIEQTSKIGDSVQGISRWANARAKDGSLFVWIPRYAYKITYYDKKGNEIGYSTNEGIIDSKGNIIDATDSTYAQNEKVKTAGYTDYIVHPAFTTDAANGGGWESELSGLWFGKFEAKNNSGSVQVVAKESSWGSLHINQMYNYGQTATYGGSNDSNNILQSHMVKNSEWGAVAYLAHSQYGLKGGKVMKNESSSYYTGGSDTIATVYGANVYQSTTHNPYGIYDLNGGAAEYVASYVNNGHTNLSDNGNYNSGTLTYSLYGSTDTEKSTSTKFKTVYPSTVSDGGSAQSEDYSKSSNMRGDAVYETSKTYSDSTGAWYSAYSYFPNERCPFFHRGSHCNDSTPGLFYSGGGDGYNSSNIGFRVDLAF